MGTHQLAPGTVLGRYELLLPIASGGMATVWAARLKGSRGFSKTVAIKTILPSLSDDPTFEQMFLDEATIASKIQHPNVAQIIDLGEEDEVLFLAMEWVDGESLSTLSKFSRKNGTDIPLRVGLKIASQAAAGLHAAHELRDEDERLLELVHRDVSPQNILVSASGVVKIVDFGVAKAMGRGGETTAGQLKGKVPFMSPEQARGAEVDRRTDIFALGIILYRLTTGTHPFLDDSDIKTMRNIITRPVMPPRVKNPSLPVEIERVVLRALNKDPERRHQSASELESDLEAAIGAASAAIGGPVSLDEVGTFVRSTLGERDRKRRAAIRDAALKIDEAALATSAGTPSSSPPESMSGVMFTRMQTPPRAATRGTLDSADVMESVPAPRKDEVTEARAYNAKTVKAVAQELSESASAKPEEANGSSSLSQVTRVEPLAQRPALPSEPPVVSSPTLAAVEAMSDERRLLDARRSKRVFGAVAVSLAAAVTIGGLTITLMNGDGGPAAPKPSSTAAASDGRSIASGTNVEPTGQPGQVIDLASLPDSPPPSSSTAEVAEPAATKPVAVSPTPATSAPAATATAEPKPTAPPVVTATAVVVASAKPEIKPKPVDTSVPVVQTPGF